MTITVETLDESYTIRCSIGNCKRVIEREKGNPHVILIKNDRDGGVIYANRKGYSNSRTPRRKIGNTSDY